MIHSDGALGGARNFPFRTSDGSQKLPSAQCYPVACRFLEGPRVRGHEPLSESLETVGVEHCALVAEPPINGNDYDPFRRFADWRERQQQWTAEKPLRQAATVAEAKALRAKGSGYDEIARTLNDQRIRSASGRAHTAESVRKALKGKLQERI